MCADGSLEEVESKLLDIVNKELARERGGVSKLWQVQYLLLLYRLIRLHILRNSKTYSVYFFHCGDLGCHFIGVHKQRGRMTRGLLLKLP